MHAHRAHVGHLLSQPGALDSLRFISLYPNAIKQQQYPANAPSLAPLGDDLFNRTSPQYPLVLGAIQQHANVVAVNTKVRAGTRARTRGSKGAHAARVRAGSARHGCRQGPMRGRAAGRGPAALPRQAAASGRGMPPAPPQSPSHPIILPR